MKVKSLIFKVLDPIVNQLPFCLVTFFLFGIELFQNIHGRLLTYDPHVTYFLLTCRLSCLFLYVYVVACLLEIINKKWFKTLVYGIVVLFFIIKFFLTIVFGISISPFIMVLLSETNSNEASEFLQTFLFTQKGLIVLLVFFFLTIFIYFCELLYQTKMDCHKDRFRKSKVMAIVVCSFIIFSIYSTCTIWGELFRYNRTDGLSGWELHYSPNDPVSQTVYSFYSTHLMVNEEEEFEKRMLSLSNSATCTTVDSLNVVLVIGESYIKHHSSLYGYHLQTTPSLSAEQIAGNLFVYNNVVTPCSGTSTTMKNVLCTNSISDGEKWNNTVFFPTMFKHAGYDVYMWDNQKSLGQHTAITFALNSFLYNKALLSTYSQTNKRSFEYDETIVNSFDSISLTGPRNLVIFHLMGQHIDASQRFPHNNRFMHFTKDSIDRHESWMTDEKKQCIADYDNATLYNDYVIGQIINRFRDSNTVIVYFSDHGEEVYDYRDSQGRVSDGMSKNQVKYIYEIPFMIWCSDSFLRKYPEIRSNIEMARNRPFMTDNVCQVLFHLGNIKTNYYHEERDLLSPNFTPRKRIIDEQYDYDSIINQ